MEKVGKLVIPRRHMFNDPGERDTRRSTRLRRRRNVISEGFGE